MTNSPSVNSFAQSLIVKGYYDGPLDGIGIRSDDRSNFFFRAIAWDEGQWERVFAITAIPAALATQLQKALSNIVDTKGSYRLLPNTSDSPAIDAAWEMILKEVATATHWIAVVSEDLVGSSYVQELSEGDSKLVGPLATNGSVDTIKTIPRAALLEVFLQRLRE